MNPVIETQAASLLEALNDHLDAITNRNIDAFAETIASDDLHLVGADGSIIEGRENAVAAHRDWFSNDSWTFEPEILWTREEQGAGWALTRVDYREGETQRRFLLLFLFVVEDGAWKLVYDQNTPIT